MEKGSAFLVLTTLKTTFQAVPEGLCLGGQSFRVLASWRMSKLERSDWIPLVVDELHPGVIVSQNINATAIDKHAESGQLNEEKAFGIE